MRIRPISIAGISKAVCVTAALVFVAGWTVPAQAGQISVKNHTSWGYNFCTHDYVGNTRAKTIITKVKIRSKKCKQLTCNTTGCWVKRCNHKLPWIKASIDDLVRYKPNNYFEVDQNRHSCSE